MNRKKYLASVLYWMDFNNFKNVLKTNIPTKISAFLNSGKKKTLAKIVFQEWKVQVLHDFTWQHLIFSFYPVIIHLEKQWGLHKSGVKKEKWRKCENCTPLLIQLLISWFRLNILPSLIHTRNKLIMKECQ